MPSAIGLDCAYWHIQCVCDHAVPNALFPHLCNLLFLMICHDIPPVVIINVICMKIIIDSGQFLLYNEGMVIQ